MTVGIMTFDNQEFVVLPKEEYIRLLGAQAGTIPDGCVEASSFVRQSIANDLRAMREHAGLTQAELAKKLRKSQTMVSGAESGTVKTGWAYTKAVLKACGLPEDWKGPE